MRNYRGINGRRRIYCLGVTNPWLICSTIRKSSSLYDMRVYIPVGKNETIAVEPLRVLGVSIEETGLEVKHNACPRSHNDIPGDKNVSRRSKSHRGT